MNTVEETITPEKATAYLATSKGNRPLSQTYVDVYVADMKAGKWLNNGVPIIFDMDGALIDGHHRLKAVTIANIPVKMNVVRGAQEGSFATIDCGRHRTVGQILAMNGVDNYNVIASIVAANNVLKKLGRMYSNCRVNGRSCTTNSDSYDIYLKDSDGYGKAAKFAMEMYRSSKILTQSWIGGLYYFLIVSCKYSENVVVDFFSKLCSLDNCDNPTIELLRKRLINEKMSGKKTNADITFALIVKCVELLRKR